MPMRMAPCALAMLERSNNRAQRGPSDQHTGPGPASSRRAGRALRADAAAMTRDGWLSDSKTRSSAAAARCHAEGEVSCRRQVLAARQAEFDAWPKKRGAAWRPFFVGQWEPTINPCRNPAGT